jgi:hypothetical protein
MSDEIIRHQDITIGRLERENEILRAEKMRLASSLDGDHAQMAHALEVAKIQVSDVQYERDVLQKKLDMIAQLAKPD